MPGAGTHWSQSESQQQQAPVTPAVIKPPTLQVTAISGNASRAMTRSYVLASRARFTIGLLIRVTGYGRFRLCRLRRIHAWQQLPHLREVAGDAVLLPGEVVDLAVGSSSAASGISVDLGEQLLGLGLGLAGDLVGVLFCVAHQLPGVLVGVPAGLVGLGAGLRCPLLRG
jgi:hypothetical protein